MGESTAIVPRDPTLASNESYNGPASPQLKPGSSKHLPAFSNIGQVAALVKSLKHENREREIKNSRILAKYDAERPYRPEELSADGLSWKVNFSTKPLATLIDKVVPRFTTAVRSMRYLTASQLPDRFPNASDKTEEFRKEITATCRSHEGWDELLSEISLEDVLFGYCGVAWLDRFTWFPKLYQQESFLVPEGTRHTSKSAPVACFKQTYLLHELFELIADDKAATDAGWDVNEVIVSINSAVPSSMRSGFSEPYRIYADLKRESSILTTFTGSKAVEAWHTFVTEIDGHITHIIHDATSEKQLFRKDKQFQRMSDCASFYSFQHGNGKIHGSKGIGRELYAMAGVLDRARNEVVDRLQLSGKLVLQCDEKDIKRFRMSVVGNAILIAQGYKIDSQKIDGNIDSFFKLDQFLTDLLDTIAGSTSPKVFEGERVTKAAVELYASREEERRDAIIERFLTQFARMMSTIQRRLCNPDASDDDAKEMQSRLLKVMTPEELSYLANQPAVETVSDYTEAERQQMVMVAQEGRGNPLYNQRELEKRKLTAQVDAEFADAVLLPDEDPTELAEQTRLQQMECQLLQAGQPVPVSPRDNDKIHVDILRKLISAVTANGNLPPEEEPILENLAGHVQAHMQSAEKKGLMAQMSDEKQWFAGLQNTIEKLKAIAQKGQAQQQLAAATAPAMGQGAPDAAPAPPPQLLAA
jgi:hypothetical protein